jgi:hypothetical protein
MSHEPCPFVIPAKAGIHLLNLDPGAAASRQFILSDAASGVEGPG